MFRKMDWLAKFTYAIRGLLISIQIGASYRIHLIAATAV
jgi:hypothetical protein